MRRRNSHESCYSSTASVVVKGVNDSGHEQTEMECYEKFGSVPESAKSWGDLRY